MARATTRKQGLPRDSKGRIHRRVYDQNEMTEREAKSVAIAARVRIHGVPPELAGETKSGANAGTVYGRMRLKGIVEEMSQKRALDGALTADQWEAAEWYVARRNAYLRSILAKGEASGGNGQGLNLPDSDSYVDWCQKQRDTWREIQDCIRDLSVEHRSPILAAFEVFLERDVYLAHLEGTLKIGLNAIHRRFLAGKR